MRSTVLQYEFFPCQIKRNSDMVKKGVENALYFSLSPISIVGKCQMAHAIKLIKT